MNNNINKLPNGDFEVQDKLDLEEVYKDLTDPPLLITGHVKRIFRNFATLLGIKSSFAARTHTVFSKLTKS